MVRVLCAGTRSTTQMPARAATRVPSRLQRVTTTGIRRRKQLGVHAPSHALIRHEKELLLRVDAPLLAGLQVEQARRYVLKALQKGRHLVRCGSVRQSPQGEFYLNIHGAGKDRRYARQRRAICGKARNTVKFLAMRASQARTPAARAARDPQRLLCAASTHAAAQLERPELRAGS